jgi:ABC-2 type transport system ATP-binding protein
VPPREQRQRIGELLELVGLSGREKERVEGFSRGMRQRLHIARGLLHDPSVLFLDEPSIGIDPVGARELRATIATLREQGKTILLTTHYMFEADELCDRIAVISGGRIVAQDTPAALKRRVSAGSVVEVETFGVHDDGVDAIRALTGVRSVALEDRGQALVLLVQVEPGAEVTSSVLAHLQGTRIGRVSSREPTLEDAYVELVSGT